MSNNILADLQPHAVFKYFEQICAIPHGSGNVKQISDYLCEFARERNLWFKQDESYNVIIKKPASNSESCLLYTSPFQDWKELMALRYLSREILI